MSAGSFETLPRPEVTIKERNVIFESGKIGGADVTRKERGALIWTPRSADACERPRGLREQL
jgi:hypothetical protein